MMTLLIGFLLRFVQSLLAASPFILAGLAIAGVFRVLLGRKDTARLFGGKTRRSLLQAWAIGMLLPVCSLGVIPVIRELRRSSLNGGTILAFAMAAPLFNPLSLLYGLTLSEPLAILAFAFCSLIVVTGVGLVWDRLFPATAIPEDEPERVPPGLKRMLAVGLAGARQAGGASAVYILIGLIGVASLSFVLSPTALQRAVNGDNPIAPLTMMGVAIPVYATPMLAMSQLGMMFQHANSPGAAFVLLALGAGMNLGLVAWMFRQYGWKRSLGWFSLLLVVVLGLAYGVDRPLFPKAVDVADHTHAFDIYCRPFPLNTSDAASKVIEKLRRDVPVYELYAASALMITVFVGVGVNLFDRENRIEAWLRTRPEAYDRGRLDVNVPAPVLGGVALVLLVAISVAGCYAYYPSPEEVVEEMKIAKVETLSAANVGDVVQAEYWINVYDGWTRKLEVGTFLRDWKLSEYHRTKARILREQLEFLEHDLENEQTEEIRHVTAKISRTHRRLAHAYLYER
ncbi:MAG: permease [Planctomycetaceae bacterium]|nr:permease [Planctomycetaceae bacterium]